MKAESPLHRKSKEEISRKGLRAILGLALTANAAHLHKIGTPYNLNNKNI